VCVFVTATITNAHFGGPQGKSRCSAVPEEAARLSDTLVLFASCECERSSSVENGVPGAGGAQQEEPKQMQIKRLQELVQLTK
jgi:hypothetical protein